MGRRAAGPRRGVYVRTYRNGRQAIQIAFTYRGVECREVLGGLEPTEANLAYAARLKAQVDQQIHLGAFDYLATFPNSKRARLFGRASGSQTVRELAEDWMADVRADYPHSTARAYCGPVERWVVPTWGALPVAQLDQVMIRDQVKALARKGLALKTIRNHLTPLRSILDVAVDRRIIDTNPATGIEPARVVGRRRSRTVDRVDPFSQGEVEAVLAAARAYAPLWGHYWAFAFYTGLRTSELYALRWADVDLARPSVHVHRATVEAQEKEVKTAAGERDVLLLPAALDALVAMRAQTELAGHGHVFVNAHTRRPLVRYSDTDRAWGIILKRARVRYRNQYQTRHTYASQLLSAGENPWFVARQLGHKTVDMVMRVYGRWVEQGGRLDGHEFRGEFGTESRADRAHGTGIQEK